MPNATTDIATFGTSNLTNVSDANANTYLDSAIFSSGAPPYTLTLDISALFLYGAGIVNNSGVMQSFLLPEDNGRYGAVLFYNSASAGNMTSYTAVGGFFSFNDTSSAGSATFGIASFSDQAHMYFFGSSTAADAIINASADADVGFLDNTTSGNATLNLTTASFVSFEDEANADQAIVNCMGGDQYFGASVFFEQFASAGQGTFTTMGGSTSGEKGAFIDFDSSATADHATFVIGGALAAGLTATKP